MSEPTLGEIRLAWWREALSRAAQGESTGQPVADAMGALLRAHPQLRPTLERLIDARRFDVAVKIMPDEAALKAYIDDTAGAMFAAAAELLGAKGEGVRTVARAGGLAYGLTGLMRALPVHAAQGRIDLPADRLRRHGTSPEQILAGEMSEGLAALLGEFRAEARASLREALRAMRDLAPAARTAFLPLALVEPYLAALARETRDALHEVAEHQPALPPLASGHLAGTMRPRRHERWLTARARTGRGEAGFPMWAPRRRVFRCRRHRRAAHALSCSTTPVSGDLEHKNRHGALAASFAWVVATDLYVESRRRSLLARLLLWLAGIAVIVLLVSFAWTLWLASYLLLAALVLLVGLSGHLGNR